MGIRHIAIRVQDDEGKNIMLHKSNNQKNSCGGKIMIESEADFLKGRKIIASQKGSVQTSVINDYLDKHFCSSKYQLFTDNCEMFANEILTGKKSSPQLIKGFVAVGLFVGLVAIIKSNETPSV